MNWESLDTAPRDGQPVWARGYDWGKRGNPMHYGWVYFSDGWQWAGSSPRPDDSSASFVIEWLPRPTGVLQ
jgi:hypothetical protein